MEGDNACGMCGAKDEILRRDEPTAFGVVCGGCYDCLLALGYGLHVGADPGADAIGAGGDGSGDDDVDDGQPGAIELDAAAGLPAPADDLLQPAGRGHGVLERVTA